MLGRPGCKARMVGIHDEASGGAAVEDRIAKWTMVPVVNGEGIQVLRYEPTEK